jgi:hypothetical protein
MYPQKRENCMKEHRDEKNSMLLRGRIHSG